MERANPVSFLFSFEGYLSPQAGSSLFSSGLVLPHSACPPRVKRYSERGFGSVCRRLGSSYDDGAADGTTGHKIRALVRGEAAHGASVPTRSADNGPGIHMAKIAVGA